MLFFTILIIMLAQVMAILQVGRTEKFVEMMKEDSENIDFDKYKWIWGRDYVRTGLWIGEIFWTMRAAIGDFEIIYAS